MSEIFTIISLMIGLFGGSISVIVVIRAACERRISSHLKEASEIISELESLKCKEDNLTKADSYRDRIKKSGNPLQYIVAIPSIIFLIWILLTSFHISLSSDRELSFNWFQQDSQEVDQSKIVETHGTKGPIQAIFGGIKVLLKNLLFCKKTILYVTIIYSLCVYIAWNRLKSANKQMKKLRGLHKTLKTEKTPKLEKVNPPTTPPPTQVGAKGVTG